MSNRTIVTSWRIVSTLAITFLAAGCASMRTADLQGDDPEARAQIERRLREVFVAAESKDFARLESYHLYGPKFTRFSGTSAARQDATATRKIEHDGLASLQGLKMRADALKIDVFGPVGIATFILDNTFDAGGKAVSTKYLSTLVFVKESGDWKIAHEHLSTIPLAEPDGPAPFRRALDHTMLKIFKSPTRIQAAGTPPKTIEEFIGRVTSGTTAVSIARMVSPPGWTESGQTPEFDEFTVVLRGQLHIETRDGDQDVLAGQAVIMPRGEWVRYSTPSPEGAEYVAVCLPAFSPLTVHRDAH